jgi:nitrogen fixation protein FixH
MTSRLRTFTVSVLAAAVLTACGGGGEQAPQPAPDRPVGAAEGVEIAFRSEPTPPKMGQNAFEVTVRDEHGAPVTDATVTVEFYMPAMPEMKMPEMRDTATLRHESGGVYRGTGNVIMAGAWDVTVTATRNGKEIGRRTLKVTAQQ